MIAEYIKLEWDKKHEAHIDLGLPIDLQARATVIPYKATVVARNTEICQLDGMAQADTYDMSIAFNNGQSYMMKFWQQSTNLGTIKSLADIAGKMISGDKDAMGAMMPRVYDAAGNMVGEIRFVTMDGKGLQSYYAYRLIMSGKVLDSYIVGVDRKTYFCMYDDAGQMVATVNKVLPVRNGKARYTMYIEYDEWAQMVIMMTEAVHHREYEGESKQGLGGWSENRISFQKGLKEKYQPDFINRVITQEGSANLPENMPLVAEKVRESQNTLQLILMRIGWVVFAVAFIGLLVFVFMSKK